MTLTRFWYRREGTREWKQLAAESHAEARRTLALLASETGLIYQGPRRQDAPPDIGDLP